MLKRFCDACLKEVASNVKYFEVMITAKQENEHNEPNFYGDYCFHCVKDGKATMQLIKEFQQDEAEKR